MMYTKNTNLIEYVEQVEAENARLKGFLSSIIIEAHRDHYGDATTAYSIIKDIIQEIEKRMGADTVDELCEKGGKPDWCSMVEAEIDETEPVKDWISIKDRLPDDGVEVLVHDTDCGVLIGWYDKKDNIFVCEFINQLDAVTHWMPLPEPPKEDDTNDSEI